MEQGENGILIRNSCLLSSDTSRGDMPASAMFETVARNFDIPTGSGLNVSERNISYRDSNPINEFVASDYALAGAFPDVFLFGKAYGRKKGTLTKYQRLHLLTQFTNNAGTCIPLIFYLFDQLL